MSNSLRGSRDSAQIRPTVAILMFGNFGQNSTKVPGRIRPNLVRPRPNLTTLGQLVPRPKSAKRPGQCWVQSLPTSVQHDLAHPNFAQIGQVARHGQLVELRPLPGSIFGAQSASPDWSRVGPASAPDRPQLDAGSTQMNHGSGLRVPKV